MNHYQTLGVKRNATQEEIKDAYKSLIKKYHPDVYQGDKTFAEKKTKEFNQAYDVLSNPTSKAEYDESLNSREVSSYSYTPPSYTPPSYSSKYAVKNSQYSYDNYKRTNPQYGEYDYQKRYSDFHRSKVPNSNYEQGPIGEDVFSTKIQNLITNLLRPNTVLVIIGVISLYLVIFVVSYMQMNTVLNKEPSIENTEIQNTVIEDELYPSNSFNLKREDFDLEDYFSFSDLYNIYIEEYSDAYESYDEFKTELEDFIFENYISKNLTIK